MPTTSRTNTAVWLDDYNRWQIKVMKNGVRKTFTDPTPGRKGQRACNAKADAWLNDDIVDGNRRISALFADYLNELKITASRTNYLKTKSIGDNWILPYLGKLKIAQLNEQHLQDMINKAYKKGLAKKSLENIRGFTNTFIKYCRKRQATRLFPENVTIPKGAPTKPKNILQPDGLKILFSSDKTTLYNKVIVDPYIDAYRFEVITGVRPGELMALKKSQINNRIVALRNSKNSLNEITEGKNGNARRRFALTDRALQIVEKQMEKNPDSDFLFGEMTLSRYEKYWNRYRKYNGLGDTTLYELRHTFVSISKNLPEGKIKPIIGHSQNMDTFGVYGHEIAGELEDTADKISQFFDLFLK